MTKKKERPRKENYNSLLFKEFLLNKELEDHYGNLIPIIQKFKK